MYKLILLAGIFFPATVILNSCVKDDLTATSTVSTQQYAENNVLNRDLFVSTATDDNTDITAHFNGITFHFTGSGLSGSATAANDLLSVSGTWSLDTNYDKITFSFPTDVLASLAFMNKQWLINISSSTLVMLSAANGETDVLYFAHTK